MLIPKAGLDPRDWTLESSPRTKELWSFRTKVGSPDDKQHFTTQLIRDVFFKAWILSWNVLLFSCNLIGQLCLSDPVTEVAL